MGSETLSDRRFPRSRIRCAAGDPTHIETLCIELLHRGGTFCHAAEPQQVLPRNTRSVGDVIQAEWGGIRFGKKAIHPPEYGFAGAGRFLSVPYGGCELAENRNP